MGGSTPFVLTYLKIEMSGPSEGHDAPEPSVRRASSPGVKQDILLVLNRTKRKSDMKVSRMSSNNLLT